MLRKLAPAAFFGLLVGCQAPALPPELSVTPVTLTGQQTQAVERGVKVVLKDPDSARFGPMKAGVNSAGKVFVCGYVNARNSFGGYTGMTPFSGEFVGPSFAQVAIGGDGSVSQAILQVCARQGLPI